jgi:hypothetical protein
MEVFSKYFRRLLTGNAPQIFPGVNKSVENAGNYPLLVQEMQKVSSDIEQAQKIAETVDTSEGDIFRDFDLSTFLDHFRLDPIVKVALALAFKMTNKSDLRAKGKFFVFYCAAFICKLTFYSTSRCNPLEFGHSLPAKSGNSLRSNQGFSHPFPGNDD